ncbi:MAG: hypothetical protein ABSG86_23425 [Thermoguttaceae bacterium]|jgi:transcriptional regulator with XRE-family HTH domain
MIPAWKVEAIQTLLAEGRMTQRAIAKQVRVWRGAVADIAHGTRPAHRGADRETAPDALWCEGPPERCPSCGGLVNMPCLACRTRAERPYRPRGVAGPCDPNERLELRLSAMHRIRYEEIRARRKAEVLGLGS